MCIINEIKADSPDPCHDVDYYLIADGTRSSSYASAHYFSDQSGHTITRRAAPWILNDINNC